MAKYQRHKQSFLSLLSLAIVTAFLLLGYCPLRNILLSLAQHQHTIPKTNGAHLLVSDDACKGAVINPLSAVQQQITDAAPAPAWFAVTNNAYPSGFYAPKKISSFTPAPVTATFNPVPIYLRKRVLLI